MTRAAENRGFVEEARERARKKPSKCVRSQSA